MEISQDELEVKINSGEKLIVDFYAEWCGPCKLMKPTFDRISNENQNVQMYTLNVDSNKELAVKLGVRSIPTIKVFSDGELIENKVGAINERDILKLIELLN